MRIAGHHGIGVFLRNMEECITQCGETALDIKNFISNVEMGIYEYLIVARPCCVEFTAELTTCVLNQIRFDVHVYVFFIRIERKIAVLKILFRFAEPAQNFSQIGI